MLSHKSLVRLYRAKTLSPSFSPEETQVVRSDLLSWYDEHRRLLPWRGDQIEGYPLIPPSGYGTWISEIMCQQTRVDTVIAYWFRWMERFPSVQALAAASPEEVNVVWAGLGYYRRASQILKCAQQLVELHGGSLPESTEELLKLPGIGPYTAGAISSVAFGKVTGVVDGNVMRVMSRLRVMDSVVGPGLDKACWRLVDPLVDPIRPGDFNQAVMELGATVCKPTSPGCDICPVRKMCHAHQLVSSPTSLSSLSESPTQPVASTTTVPATTETTTAAPAPTPTSQPAVEDIEDLAQHLPQAVTDFPRKAPKKAPKELLFAVCVLKMKPLPSLKGEDEDTRFLFVRRPAKGLLQNQWEFPTAVQSADLLSAGYDSLSHGSKLKFWLPHCQLFLQSEFGVQLNDRSSHLPTSGIRFTLWTEDIFLHPEPIVHVFSHQRHTMHVIEASFDANFCVFSDTTSASTCADVNTLKGTSTKSKTEISDITTHSCKLEGKAAADTNPTPSTSVAYAKWRTSEASGGRDVEWMTLQQLRDKGVTTGVQKVIALATSAGGAGKSSGANKSKASEKRKKELIRGDRASTKTRKISQYFTRE